MKVGTIKRAEGIEFKIVMLPWTPASARGAAANALKPARVFPMAATRPPCPQCSTPHPAVIEFDLFALPDAKVDELLANGWRDASNFVWQCAGCKHEWAVG